MAEQEKAKDNVIERALFSDLHALKTLFMYSLSCHSERSEESQTTS